MNRSITAAIALLLTLSISALAPTGLLMAQDTVDRAPATETTADVDTDDVDTEEVDTEEVDEDASASADDELDEAQVADMVAQMALVNPPPQLSTLEPGVTITPCEAGAPLGSDEIEGETYYCGIFTAPMDWENPSAGNLDLNFVVVKASGDNPAPDPLLFVAGGPGQSAIISTVNAYERLRPQHDIVRLAQRGAGYGQRLGLEECLVLALQDEEAEDQVGALLEMIMPDAEAAGEEEDADDLTLAPALSEPSSDVDAQVSQLCWKEFMRTGIDLNQFTTTNSARDLIALVEALDYPSFNLHGISYGTRLAMTVMREVATMDGAPTLRSVVLDSPIPPSVYMLSSLPRNPHDQVLQLLAECRNDDACRTAYPNLEGRLHDLLDRLATEPLTVDGETVTATALAETLWDLSGSRAGFMPQMIAQLESDMLETYLALRNQEIGVDGPEGAMSLDLNDPVQALVADAIPLFADGNEGALFELMGAIGDAAANEDPLATLERYVNENLDGELGQTLLDDIAAMTAEEFLASSFVAQMQEVSAATDEVSEPLSPEEQATAEQQQQRLLASIDIAHFLNKNIHCNEDYQFERLEDGINSVNDLTFPRLTNVDLLNNQADSCAEWPVAAASIEVKNPVSSTVPALILQGAYDTRTPVFMGRRAARELREQHAGDCAPTRPRNLVQRHQLRRSDCGGLCARSQRRTRHHLP